MNRLEAQLRTLAQQHTTQLVMSSEDFNDRVEQVAKRLAREGVLVLVGDLSESRRAQRAEHVQLWINAYAELYYLFSQGLFGATDEPVAYFADDQYPLIIVFRAKTLPVIELLAGLFVPYIAHRQADKMTTRAEVRGIIEIALDDMEGSDLPLEQYGDMRNKGIDLLSQLLQSDIQQVALTQFKESYILKLQSGTIPVAQAKRPDTLPELPKQRIDTGQLSPTLPPNVLKLPRREELRSATATKPPVPSLLDRARRQSQ